VREMSLAVDVGIVVLSESDCRDWNVELPVGPMSCLWVFSSGDSCHSCN